MVVKREDPVGAGVRLDDDVGRSPPGLIFFPVHHAEHRRDHFRNGLVGVGAGLLEMVQVHRDDIVRTHFLDDIDRKVVEHAAVHEKLVAQFDRGEIARD